MSQWLRDHRWRRAGRYHSIVMRKRRRPLVPADGGAALPFRAKPRSVRAGHALRRWQLPRRLLVQQLKFLRTERQSVWSDVRRRHRLRDRLLHVQWHMRDEY